MRDEEIRGLLHTLEEDRDPDPAFADHLYLRLMGTQRRAARRWPLVLLAAAALTAIAGGAALGSGLLESPITAEATPTASSTLTTSESPSASPTPHSSVPSPDVTATPEPPAPAPTATSAPYARPQNILPPGGLAVVEVDALRIRTGPSLASEAVGTAGQGEIVYVADGHAGPGATIPPVRADGLEWYHVTYAPGHHDWPIEPAKDDVVRGWVARGPAGDPYVELLAPRCPNVTDLSALQAITAYERVACVGDEPIGLIGTIGCPYCDSLSHPGTWEPGWLAGYFRLPDMFTASWEGFSATEAWPPFIILAWPPEQPKPGDDIRGSTMRVTGHFADARSADCVIASDVDGEVVASDPEAAEWYCRTLFVVESWEILGTDPHFERDPF